jgi:DNA-binding IclR family transcriptional regulator
MQLQIAQIADWLRLVQAEYDEMPGLNLTKPQVQRLWGIDESTCDAVLETLQAERFLRRTERNAYVRASDRN